MGIETIVLLGLSAAKAFATVSAANKQAEAGILFKSPQNVIDEFPQFPAVHEYDELKAEFIKASEVHS